MNKSFLSEFLDNYKQMLPLTGDGVFCADSCEDMISAVKGAKGSADGKIFLVCGLPSGNGSLINLTAAFSGRCVLFTGFSPNPKYEEIISGISLFEASDADVILGLGGGSAIDTAKCIRYYSHAKRNVPLLAVPTTAGTGSEATGFAVYYKEGVKQSLDEAELLPDRVILYPELVRSLPVYQKKCTFMDAFCQSCESAFNINRTPESLKYAFTALKAMSLIKDVYLKASPEELGELDEEIKKYISKTDASMRVPRSPLFLYALLCAHIAGRAINITRTAGPHAMSYRLSSMKKLPHGHAVAVCFRACAAEMFRRKDDPELSAIYKKIAKISFGCGPSAFASRFGEFLKDTGLDSPVITEEEASILASSVNAQRLKNNPVAFSHEELKAMYLGL